MDIDDSPTVVFHQLWRNDPVKRKAKQIELRVNTKPLDFSVEPGPISSVEPGERNLSFSAEFRQIAGASSFANHQDGHNIQPGCLVRRGAKKPATA